MNAIKIFDLSCIIEFLAKVNINIKNSAHDTFLKQPPSGTLNATFLKQPPSGTLNATFLKQPPSGTLNATFLKQPPSGTLNAKMSNNLCIVFIVTFINFQLS
jgi:hypothetical protein